MAKKEREPEGGWLAPPPSMGLKPLATASRTDKKGNWIWDEVKQTRADKERRAEWERRKAKAEAKGNATFKWPPKE